MKTNQHLILNEVILMLKDSRGTLHPFYPENIWEIENVLSNETTEFIKLLINEADTRFYELDEVYPDETEILIAILDNERQTRPIDFTINTPKNILLPPNEQLTKGIEFRIGNKTIGTKKDWVRVLINMSIIIAIILYILLWLLKRLSIKQAI